MACGNSAGTTKQADSSSAGDGSSQAAERRRRYTNVIIGSPRYGGYRGMVGRRRLISGTKKISDIQVKREAIDRAVIHMHMENKITTATTSGIFLIVLYGDGPKGFILCGNGITVPLDSYFPADDLKDFMPSTSSG